MSSPNASPARPRSKSVSFPKEVTQIQRKARSNPSSPRQKPSSSPLKPAQSLLGGAPAVVLGKERDLVPYFGSSDPEGARNLCELGGAGKPRPRKQSTSSLGSPFAPPSKQVNSAPTKTSSPKTPQPRHQYAGAAFENSPPPECLPQPSFLNEGEAVNSVALSSPALVPQKLEFDTQSLMASSNTSSCASSASSSPSSSVPSSPSASPVNMLLTSETIATATPSNAAVQQMFSHQGLLVGSFFLPPPHLPQHHQHYYYHQQHQLIQMQQEDVLFAGSVHLKRLLNISQAVA